MMKSKIVKKLMSFALSMTMTSQLAIASLPDSAFAAYLNTDYIIYSSEDININMNTATFNGDIFTDDSFNFTGSNNCYVNNTLNADKTNGNIKINNKVKADSDKPDYTSQLENNVHYSNEYSGDAVIEGEKYDLSDSVYSKGNLWLNRTSLSGQGYIRADGSIQYDAVENEDNTEFLLYSKNGNITVQGSNLTLDGVIYAPNGKVEINAKNLHIRGTIVAKSVELNGTNFTFDKLINGESELLKFGPEINFGSSEDTFKQNRKITLDISDSFGLKDIDENSIEWKFTNENSAVSENVKIDETDSTNLKKNLIITEPGIYHAVLTAKDKEGKSYNYSKILNIVEDKAPVASFWKDSDIAGRDEDGKAVINLEDTSYSLDGDSIESRRWSVYFDSDNDGDFNDEKEEVFNIGNNKEVTYEAASVGNYMFRLIVAENIHDTIPSLISDDAYRIADSSETGSVDSKVEVTNEAPKSYSGISKAKNVDIVVTVGSADLDDIDTLNENIDNIKEELESKGYSVNLSTVSASTLTAKDTFAWNEYDHYDYADWYNQTLPQHIVYEDESIKMLGYFWAPLRDWLFVDDGIKAKRVLSFDMVRDKTDWHSMEGGGFLFNTTIRDEKKESENPDEEPETVKIMDGYCILLTSTGFSLVQLSNVDVEYFRNQNCPSVGHAGKVLKTARVSNVYDNYNVKIVASDRVVSVYANDNCIIDNFVLPEQNTGNGFGPITSHISHGCNQQSYFTFSNIKMSTINGSELSDVLDKHEWRDSAKHYVINLSKNKLVDLNDNASAGAAVKSLINNNADFITLGTSESKPQYENVLKSVDGVYTDWYDFIKQPDILKNYILNDLSGEKYEIENDTITTSDEIEYNNSFVDKENDPVSDQIWNYEIDSSVYENSSRESGKFTSEKPIVKFDSTGKYSINSKLCDDPTNGNKNLDSYKKWSNEVKWTDSLFVHSKPIAEIKAETFSTPDPEKFICKIEFNAYDTDMLSHENKGISKEIFEWKCVDDSEWHDGTIPEIIDAEQFYLQKYTVCDEMGEWSKPCVELVYAEKTENTSVFEDNEPPQLEITVSDENPSVDDRIAISLSAKDNTELTYTKLMVNGKVVAQYPGTVLYDCKSEGELVISAEAEDLGKNKNTIEKKITVTDRRDLKAPVITVNTKQDVVYNDGTLTINGSVTDNVKLDNYKISYAPDGSSEYQDVFEADSEVNNDVIGTIKLPEGEGKYNVRITAEDTSHNKAYITIVVTVTAAEVKNTNGGGSSQLNKPEKRTDTPAEITLTASKDKAEIGEMISVTADATDVDGLKTFKIYLDSKLIAESPGTFRFTKGEAMVSAIRVDTVDINGGKSTKSIEVVFEDHSDRTPPTAEIVSPENNSEVNGKVRIIGSAVDETKLRGYSLDFRKKGSTLYTNIVSSLSQIENKEIGIWDTTQLDNGEYEVKLTATDNGGNTAELTYVYVVKNGAEYTEEEIAEDFIVFSRPEKNVTADEKLKIEATADSSISGAEYQVYIRKDDVTTVIQNGKISGNGVISADVDTSLYEDGTYVVGIAAQKGETTAQKEVTAVVNHGNKAPESDYVCKIVSPEQMIAVTDITEIKAEVSDKIFDKYKMEYSPAGKNKFVIFAKGSINGNTVTGKFDPTMIFNGYYDIRFTAFGKDVSASDTITVSVEGQMKIGNFTLNFSDLTLNAGGIPISVDRTYDSRKKNIKGDFGYGWDMAFDDVKLTISGNQGENWEQTTTSSWFINNYSVSENVKHIIKIDLGNGAYEEFRMTISPSSQSFIPIMYGVSVGYVPVGNSGSTLEPCTSSDDLLFVNNTLIDGTELYNPQEFIYTRSDGTKYRINASSGLKSITTEDGKVISFNKNGIVDKDGNLIEYTYDSDGKILKIESKSGETVSYEYNIFGDLTAVTDVSGDKVTFKYDKNHYLTEIYGADGKLVSKNEYDEDGRLIKSIDGAGNAITYSHDVEGKEEVITDRNGGVTKYVYDDKGNILAVTDQNGNTIKNSYDENGNIASKTDALGNVTTYECTENGDIKRVTDALGDTLENNYNSKGYVSTITSNGADVIKFSYDDKGRQTSVVSESGKETDYEYDEDGNLTSITDSIGTYMNMTYDKNGNVVSLTDSSGTKSEFTYDDKGNCITKTVSYTSDGTIKKLTESYEYDCDGNVVKAIDCLGNVSTIEYNSAGKTTARTDAEGRKTSYKYDVLGNLTGITYPDGTSESFTYDKAGNNLTAKDRLGRTVTMEYDKVGNLISKTYNNGSKTVYEYDANYNLISITDVNGNVTSYTYDEVNRNTSIIDAMGNVTSFTYNDRSQLASRTDPLGNVTKYVYDKDGNITETIFADGSKLQSSYDERGRVTSQTDQSGHKTEYYYNSENRLSSVKDALGNETSYTYDELGNLTSVKDANGNVTKYSYDEFGRVVRTTNALGKTADITYDQFGNVLTSSDYAGNVKKYAYDNLGRVSTITVGKDVTRYNYTRDGKINSVSSPSGTTSFAYSDMDYLTKVSYPNGKYVEYSYDNIGRVTSVGTAYGKTAYEYDILDRVTKVIDKNGYATVYEYDKNGNRSAVKYANGIVVSYKYDSLNRLISEEAVDSENNIIASYFYTLGASGERTFVRELDRTVAYTYDELFRLTGEKIVENNGNVVEYNYTYDKVSNRITKTVNGKETRYVYNELNQLINENNIVYMYDDAGNLVSQTDGSKNTEFSYNSNNKLVKSTVKDGENETVTEYEYDYAGNRTVQKSGDDYTYYLNDINGSLTQVIAELDKNGNLKCWYTRGNGLISQERNSETLFYLSDGQNSVRQLANMEGKITDTYTYDAYGVMISSTGSAENNYLYCGEQYDDATGLYYLRARYMNPSTGTFISMDTYQGTIFDPTSLHKYLYANANPVMNSDPTGNFTLCGMSVSMNISSILDNMSTVKVQAVMKALKSITVSAAKTALKGALKGALFGGLFGAADAWLGGGDFGEILDGLLQGMAFGACIGAAISVMFFAATYIPQIKILLHFCNFVFLAFGGLGTYESITQGNYVQAIFRAITTIVSCYKMGKAISEIKVIGSEKPLPPDRSDGNGSGGSGENGGASGGGNNGNDPGKPSGNGGETPSGSGDNSPSGGSPENPGTSGGNQSGGAPSDKPNSLVKHGNSRPPETSDPNTVYEQLNPDGTVKSRAFYDENGRQFCRQDFDHTHFEKSLGELLNEHEHYKGYNENGQPVKLNPNAGPLPEGYDNSPNWF